MDDHIPVGKILMWLLAAMVAVTLLGWALGWFGLFTQRPMARYQEETRAQTYDSSRQYQQGTNRDVARYCEQMRSATTPAARAAVGALIRSTVSTYDGPLSTDNQTCVADARAN